MEAFTSIDLSSLDILHEVRYVVPVKRIADIKILLIVFMPLLYLIMNVLFNYYFVSLNSLFLSVQR